MSETSANSESKILSFDIITQDTRRLWARVVLEISSKSPQLVLPTRNPNSTTTNDVIITRKLPPLSENKQTMGWHGASQISVHAQSMEFEMALDTSQLRTNYANPAGYGEEHIWTTSIGAYLGEGMDYRGLSRVCIDTGSQRLMVINTPQPFTWDPIAGKFLEERTGSIHRAIDTTKMASTPLSTTDTPLSTTDSSGAPVVKKLASYVGGASLYGNEYEGDLCILGASNERTGIAPLHKVEKVKFGGVIGATSDMMGSAMDGVLGLQPSFDNQGADFIHKLAEAYGLKDDVFLDVFMERNRGFDDTSRFLVGAYSPALLAQGLRFIKLRSIGDRAFWSVKLHGLGVGDKKVTYPDGDPAVALADSGAVFSYFNSDLVDGFYTMVEGAQLNNGIWTFPYPKTPRKFPRISVHFDCGTSEYVEHGLTLRQFVWEKGEIPAGRLVHGIFQKPNAKDDTVAELFSEKFPLQIIGQEDDNTDMEAEQKHYFSASREYHWPSYVRTVIGIYDLFTRPWKKERKKTRNRAPSGLSESLALTGKKPGSLALKNSVHKSEMSH
ncbi:aspartic peptidase domain-containing protein [Mycena sp. CBHHK59/15]|nr:aspartic peptidase domain-containing protein [Mycena sp. CBHHK59/15]